MNSLLETLKGAVAAYKTPATRFPAEPWFIDAIDTSGGGLTVRGWAFVDDPRLAGDPSGRFSFNGRPFDRVDYPLLRKDVGDCFPARQDADHCGFLLVADDVREPYHNGFLEISCRDRCATGAASGRDTWYAPDSALHTELPDEDSRFRVIGNRDAAGFLLSGCTDFHRLDRACVAITGKPMAGHARILDWGCGCGRVARYLAPSATSFSGCDIDADNVAWCTEHLAGRYSVSALRPPLPFEDDAFDLIYGVSVFTHFRADIETLWLEELARVAAPGATLLMTVHGQTTVDYARLDIAARCALLNKIDREGILCSGRNEQLDGHAAHENEYVNVYHSHRYIHRTWGRHFEIVDILGGYIFTHDLVVMRKR